MHDIKLKPVKSSNLKAVGYHPESQTLRVEFAKGNGSYDYTGVPAEEHEALIASGSPGNHFHGRIKMAYPHTKVAAEHSEKR